MSSSRSHSAASRVSTQWHSKRDPDTDQADHQVEIGTMPITIRRTNSHSWATIGPASLAWHHPSRPERHARTLGVFAERRCTCRDIGNAHRAKHARIWQASKAIFKARALARRPVERDGVGGRVRVVRAIFLGARNPSTLPNRNVGSGCVPRTVDVRDRVDGLSRVTRRVTAATGTCRDYRSAYEEIAY